MNKKKYTYDEFCFQGDGNGYGAGTGSESLNRQREIFKVNIKYYPKNTSLIIRRPDNKLMNFYHPFIGNKIPE